MGNPR